MATEKAAKPDRPELEIRTRTPKKPGLFDAVGSNRQPSGTSVHPIREMLDRNSADESADSQPSTTTPSSPTTPPSPSSRSRQTRTTRLATRTSPSSTPTPTSTGSTASRFETAPGSDYQKYPNANIREIPNGIFPGKSKLVYDVLYSLTRGAIKPSRTVRISKPQLMAKAGIGSKVTLDKVVEHFRNIRLVNVEERPGEHLGNVYEVLIFGEHESHTTQASGTSTTTQSSPTQNLVVLDSAESSQSSTSAESINMGVPAAPKTFFKDFLNHDDEKPLHEALERFAKTAQETTGREVTKADCLGLAQAINQIIDEAVAGAARTDVTCFGKFAAENLKRRLSRKPRSAGSNKVEFFDPGRHDHVLDESAVEIVEMTPDPLGERRELHLESLRGMVENHGIEHIDIYRSGYTDEDWAWLTERLGTGSNE